MIVGIPPVSRLPPSVPSVLTCVASLEDSSLLWSQFLTHGGRLCHKWCHYFPIYERHFARFVNTDLFILEIGCGEGGSLQMWKRYFGPLARIVGVDVRPECAAFEEDQISIRIGDQSDPAFLAKILEEFGQPDIVIDDGSHIQAHVMASFVNLYFATRSVYLVEDLHTAYWAEFGGVPGGSFIDVCKGLIDKLNAHHARPPAPDAFTDSTLSMHFYDSVCVFEKGRNHLRSVQIGHTASEWDRLSRPAS